MKWKLLLVLAMVGAADARAQDCSWLQRQPLNRPDKPVAEVMAFDSLREVAVLFSPVDSPNLDQRQTLEWDGTDWSLRAADGPPWLEGAAMVYDSARKASVLFGGLDHGGIGRTNTWEWDGIEWRDMSPVNRPKARYRHSMAYDSRRSVVVMFGGLNEDDNAFGDTWEWDGQIWLRVATDGPTPSAGNAMAYDSNRGVTVLYGTAPWSNETWEWDGKTWAFRTDQGPERSIEGAMVYDSARKVCVLYGGHCQFCGSNPSDETWQWDGQVWTKLDTPVNPGPRAEHAMAYDSARNTIVLFGGVNQLGDNLNDTWEFTCTPPCYPDLNADGTLDLFDFLAFVNSFNAGDAGKADCDQSGSLDLFDFLCFVNAFNAGC